MSCNSCPDAHTHHHEERIAFLADGAVKLNVTKYTLAT